MRRSWLRCFFRFVVTLNIWREQIDLFVSPHDVVSESEKILFSQRPSCDLGDVTLLFPDGKFLHQLGDQPGLIFKVRVVVAWSRVPDPVENLVDDRRQSD